MIALFLYERGKLSIGKVCELCGLSQWEFLELNKSYQIDLNYKDKDLDSDLKRLENV